MPRRKSQPAKYYHCTNESQNDEIISSETYGLYPTNEGVDSVAYTDADSSIKESPKSEGDPDNSDSDSCRTEDTLGTNNIREEPCKPSPKRRRMTSPKKENIKEDPDLGDELINSHSSSRLRHNNRRKSKAKPKVNIESSSDKALDNDEQENVRDTDSTLPKTLQDFVYRVIDIYYKRQFTLGNSYEIKNELRSRKHTDTENSRLDSPNTRSGDENDEFCTSPESYQDIANSCVNGLKLYEKLDEVDEHLFPKSPISSHGGSGCENELIVKKNGSISSDLDQCGTCFKVLKRSSMREHMDRHNDTGRYRCNVCKKTFSKLSSKEKHELIHTDQRPFKCDQCDKAYRQKIHLVEHMRSHTGERPFVCPHCNYTLASKSLLNRHLKTHETCKTLHNESTLNARPDSQQSPPTKKESKDSSAEELNSETSLASLRSEVSNDAVSCDLCQSQFQSEKQLLHHLERTHKSDNYHKCEQCSRVFSTSRGLTTHMHNTHKSAQAHPCADCSKTFAHNSSLVKHRVKEHGHRSSSLVKVLPTARKPLHEDSRKLLCDKDSLFERVSNGSDNAEIHDNCNPTPAKVPRSTIISDGEAVNVDLSLTNNDVVSELVTSNCELTGSDI